MTILTPDQITKKWLSEQLNQESIAFDIHPVEAHNSIAVRLNVHFANGESRKLFLKLKQNGEGQREVVLYQNAPQLKGIIPCFAAEYDAQTGDSCILLQDVSETHFPPLEPKQLISSAKKQSIEKISLSVSKDNYALNLYRQQGFQEHTDIGDMFLMIREI